MWNGNLSPVCCAIMVAATIIAAVQAFLVFKSFGKEFQHPVLVRLRPLNNETTRAGPTAAAPRLCSRKELRNGQWQSMVLDAPPYVPETDYKKRKCYKDSLFDPNNNESWPSWEWRPEESSCVFEDFSREAFCNVLANTESQNRTLAIVGDSLSFEHYSSFVQLMGLNSTEDDHLNAWRKDENVVQCLCDWTVMYRRSDALEHIPQLLRESSPDILIINRGAHYAADETLLPQLNDTIHHIQEWQQNCSTCQLFFRTTVPGHPKCNSFKEPSNSIEEMEDLIANFSNYAGLNRSNTKPLSQFHWWHFKHQNELMLDTLAVASPSVTFDVIDAYDINVLRPDLHRYPIGDCLHSCYPGKMDVYSQVLLHLLKLNQEDNGRKLR